MNVNISEQMVQVLLFSVRYAIYKGQRFTAEDGFGYKVNLDDAESFLEELKLVERPVGRKGSV